MKKRSAIIIGISVAAAILLIVLFYPSFRTSLFIPPNVDIQLLSVQSYENENESNSSEFKVVFKVTNPQDRPLPLRNISYDLFADGRLVGSSTIQQEGIGDKAYPDIGTKQSFSVTSLVQANETELEPFGNTAVWKINGTVQFQSNELEYLQVFSDELEH